MKPIDLTGQVFGRWTVLRRAPDRGDYVVRWVCRCGCEAEKDIASAALRKGLSVQCKSCAQHSRRSMIEARRERAIWRGMKDRCENPKNPKYPSYGVRGIVVCDRWQDFAAFFADMGFRPSKRHTLERKDNDGPYSPDNVIWALPTEQANNRRTSRFITIDSQTRTLAQWCRLYGAKVQLTHARMQRGGEPLRALTEMAGKCGGDMRKKPSV